jgi:hypothetical protein
LKTTVSKKEKPKPIPEGRALLKNTKKIQCPNYENKWERSRRQTVSVPAENMIH